MDLLRMAAMAHPRDFLDDTSADDDVEAWTDGNDTLFFKERMRKFTYVFDYHLEHVLGSPFMNKERYLLLRQIEGILLDEGVTIFGGYVRDMIIHHYGAKSFYDSDDVKADPLKIARYSDSQVHPSSYNDRNTYPKDIDCFVCDPMICEAIADQLIRKVKGTEIKELAKVSCYSHHPSYTTNFGCKRMELVYSFNSSLQKKGEKITVSIDFVYSLNNSDGPWNYLIDAACNMLYMNKTGLHSAFEVTEDPIENANRLVSIIEMTQKRVTFIPPMPVGFRSPTQECEILNIQMTRKCTEIQAVSSYRRANSLYRVLYRIKYLQRIAKLVKEGWKITNLSVVFSTEGTQDSNGEEVCAISHEDLVAGKLIVRLGVRNPEWSQTCVITWPALVEYVFRMPNVDDSFAHRYNWTIVCPISKSTIDITEVRPIGFVIREALQKLRGM